MFVRKGSKLKISNLRAGIDRSRGFTMMELITAMALTAIILAMAVPSFQIFVKNNRIEVAAEDFVTALNTARSEAMKRSTEVFLCRSTTDTGCSPSGTSNNWTEGWILYSTKQNTVVPDNHNFAAADDRLLTVGNQTPGEVTITSSATGDTHISFEANGDRNADVAFGVTPPPVRFAICDDRGETKGRVVTVTRTGQITVTDADAGNTNMDCTPTEV